MSGWRTLEPLPAARFRHALASWKNFVYVAGGSTTSDLTTTVPLSILVSRMDAGAVSNGPWLSTLVPAMTVGKIGCSLQVVGDSWLWLIGGKGKTIAGTDVAAAQDIYIGKLQADGSIPTWNRVAGALPVALSDFGVAIKDEWIYIVGGTVGGVSFNYTAQTGNFTAGQVVTGHTSGAHGTIMTDTDGGATGTLKVKLITGVFVDDETITDPLGGAALANGALSTNFLLDYDTQTGNFTVGQTVTGAGGATGVISADADAGATGTLTLTSVVGNFVSGENITDPITGAAKVVTGTTQYKTLSYDAQTGNFTVGDTLTDLTSGATGILFSQTDSGATGSLVLRTVTGTFANTHVVTGALGGSATINSVPAIDIGTSTACYRARIESAGAGVGPFTLLATILPQSSTPVNSLVFAGNSLQYLAADKLYTARWFPGGEIGPFLLSSPGFSRVDECMLANQADNLLVIGGYTGSAVSANVYHTKIEADGSVKRWTQTTPLPTAKQKAACCTLGNDLVFSVGGIDSGSSVLTEVLVARVDASGLIGGQSAAL